MSDVNYLFCSGGYPISKVWKIKISDMSKVAEGADYGKGVYDYGNILSVTALGDHVYCGGYTEPPENRTVWQMRKSDMIKVGEGISHNEWIFALTSFGSYVYCGGNSPYKVWKLDPSDMSKVAESVNYGGIIEALTKDSNYVYCAGVSTQKVWKIDPSDLTKLAESANYGGHIFALATDGTYVYCGGRAPTGGGKVWKIRVSDMAKVAESDAYGYDIKALTVFDGHVYCAGSITKKVWKIDASDMSKVDESADYGGGIKALANDGTYIYCGGTTTNAIWKIDVSDMSKVAELAYGTGINALVVSLAPALYDYPLAPVMFPAKVRKSSLREKCVNFETSMSDVCLVFNHNVRVTREYLQLTYGDTTYPESSNLRYVLPSQQLVKLSNKDLTEEDFKAIISNFITNISSMFTLINENNTLIKTWLDDYMPNEEGHEFTNVKMRPIVVGEDLSKTMDDLFKGIIDNVTILNMNLEVLKERF